MNNQSPKEHGAAKLIIPSSESGDFRGNDLIINLPIITGSCGNPALDTSKLGQDSGYFSFDPGFTSTASCVSSITFIDGDKGQLLYRGYDASKLAQECSFLEVAYLILNGDLPNLSQMQIFEKEINYHTMIHEQMIDFYKGFRRDAHPMAIMVAVVGALSAFYHDSLDINNPDQQQIASLRVVAKMPTMAAMAYKYSRGQPFAYPKNNLSYAANFLHMMFSMPTEDYVVDSICEKALNQIMILHADHEQNASTSTVRLAGSSGANPFACIAAGVASLWGPAHGGANEEVIKMLRSIGNKKNIPSFIADVKDKNNNKRLMGFGHRVYKNFDPRSILLRKSCKELLSALQNTPKVIEMANLLEVALELESIALNDDYFISRKLYPNVDFYSGIMLKAMGIPVSMFTVLFAVARSVGWVAHWKEMVTDQKPKIGRPRQIYTGHREREILGIKQRL